MAFGVHFRRSVHSVTNHIRRGVTTAARNIAEGARFVDRVHTRVRPVYERLKPHLSELINVPATDQYLRGYDAIRRSVVAAHNLHRQLQ
jgi:hypothetical protein